MRGSSKRLTEKSSTSGLGFRAGAWLRGVPFVSLSLLLDVRPLCSAPGLVAAFLGRLVSLLALAVTAVTEVPPCRLERRATRCRRWRWEPAQWIGSDRSQFRLEDEPLFLGSCLAAGLPRAPCGCRLRWRPAVQYDLLLSTTIEYHRISQGVSPTYPKLSFIKVGAGWGTSGLEERELHGGGSGDDDQRDRAGAGEATPHQAHQRNGRAAPDTSSTRPATPHSGHGANQRAAGAHRTRGTGAPGGDEGGHEGQRGRQAEEQATATPPSPAVGTHAGRPA